MGKICQIDLVILFLTKILRMFSFGAISVVFIQALLNKGVEETQIGYLQSLIAVGDIVISLFLTTRADKLGRKNTLVLSAFLKIGAGLTYAFSDNYILLIVSGAIGVLTISGGEIGPFLPVEQAALAQLVQNTYESKQEKAESLAAVYGYYNMCSYISQATGALASGMYLTRMGNLRGKPEEYYIHIFYLYALLGAFKIVLYCCMSRNVQAESSKIQVKQVLNCAGLTKKSTKIILMLSCLFFVDSFAGGFVAQSFISYYYQKKYDFSMDSIGGILFVCNIVGGISGVLSSKLVSKIGAMTTMIVTHLPSNVLLILVGLASSPKAAVLLIMARFCISQMDVPARQTYVSMVVSVQQRSAANGITNVARSVGVALAFPIAGYFWKADPQTFLFALPFLLSGALKIFYDLTLGACFLCEKSVQKSKRIVQFEELQQTDIVSSRNVQIEPKSEQIKD